MFLYELCCYSRAVPVVPDARCGDATDILWDDAHCIEAGVIGGGAQALCSPWLRRAVWREYAGAGSGANYCEVWRSCCGESRFCV